MTNMYDDPVFIRHFIKALRSDAEGMSDVLLPAGSRLFRRRHFGKTDSGILL